MALTEPSAGGSTRTPARPAAGPAADTCAAAEARPSRHGIPETLRHAGGKSQRCPLPNRAAVADWPDITPPARAARRPLIVAEKLLLAS
jgi:hypothetical protein